METYTTASGLCMRQKRLLKTHKYLSQKYPSLRHDFIFQQGNIPEHIRYPVARPHRQGSRFSVYLPVNFIAPELKQVDSWKPIVTAQDMLPVTGTS
jgi:hypothetical protein